VSLFCRILPKNIRISLSITASIGSTPSKLYVATFAILYEENLDQPMGRAHHVYGISEI
jgi:hypothetical protein